jgi:hypothetical protein
MPRWIKNWEDFAGKPYVKPKYNYPLGSVIRNTVSQAQDTLCRIQLGHIQRMLNDHYAKEVNDRTIYHINDHETGNPIWSTTPGWATEESKNRGLYPKSLGELCIEEWQNLALGEIELLRLYHPWENDFRGYPTNYSRDEIKELRTLMYHKHTDPEKERKTAKSERLIELVRNA